MAGASQTSDERIGSFIDVVGTYLPVSKMGSVGNPGSWYNFKHANKHIPVSKRKSVYNAKVNKYKKVKKGSGTFEKVKSLIDTGSYINN